MGFLNTLCLPLPHTSLESLARITPQLFPSSLPIRADARAPLRSRGRSQSAPPLRCPARHCSLTHLRTLPRTLHPIIAFGSHASTPEPHLLDPATTYTHGFASASMPHPPATTRPSPSPADPPTISPPLPILPNPSYLPPSLSAASASVFGSRALPPPPPAGAPRARPPAGRGRAQ